MRPHEFVVLTLVLCAACARLDAAPTIGSINVAPTAIKAGVPTNVTVTVAITDPTLIPASVNLLVHANGTSTILGPLHDDGQNGDIAAADQIYSIQIALNEPTAQTIQLQVSAAFRGTVKRVLSFPINISSTASGTVPLPPDPGPAGMQTLVGIDSDGDGMRDDVQRYIALTYPNSLRMQAALTQLAKGYFAEIVDANNSQLSMRDSLNASYALSCLFYVTPRDASPSQIMKQLEGQILNTHARLTAYLTAQSYITTNFQQLPTAQQQKAFCMVNPDILPN